MQAYTIFLPFLTSHYNLNIFYFPSKAFSIGQYQADPLSFFLTGHGALLYPSFKAILFCISP